MNKIEHVTDVNVFGSFGKHAFGSKIIDIVTPFPLPSLSLPTPLVYFTKKIHLFIDASSVHLPMSLVFYK